MSFPYFSQSKSNKRSKKSSLLIFISSDKNFSSSFIDCKSWKRVKHESLLIVLLLKWPEVSMDNQSCTSMPSEFILKVMHSMRHCERGRKRRAVNLWNPIRFSLNSIDSRASTYSNVFPPVFLFKPLSNTYTQETSNSLEWPLPDVFNSTWWAKKKNLKNLRKADRNDFYKNNWVLACCHWSSMDDCDEKYPKSWMSCNSLKMFPLGRISIIACRRFVSHSMEFFNYYCCLKLRAHNFCELLSKKLFLGDDNSSKMKKMNTKHTENYFFFVLMKFAIYFRTLHLLHRKTSLFSSFNLFLWKTILRFLCAKLENCFSFSLTTACSFSDLFYVHSMKTFMLYKELA